MHVTARHLVLVVGLGLYADVPSLASDFPTDGRVGQTGSPLAHLSHIEGTVTRLHRLAPAPASVGTTIVEGDQIVTAIGRAEITFADGSVMHLDEHTQVVIVSSTRIRLLDGRVSLRTTTAYTAETAGSVHVLSEGLFELTATPNHRDVLVRVVEGQAQIESPWGVQSVAATQTAFVSGPTGRPFVSSYGHLRHDAFVQWSHSSFALVSPPPAFLPYAHPAYRQFAYERLLRKGRPDRHRPGFHDRGDGRRDPSPRGNTSVEQRTNGATTSDDRQRRTRPAPAKAAKPAGPVARGARAGAAVRRP